MDHATTTKEALEPCPCNSAVDLRFDRIEIGNWVQVVCDNCGRRGAQGGSQWMAERLWNQDRSRIPAPIVAPEVDDPANMTDAELRAATTFHQAQAARYSNESAKVWRLRLRMGHPAPGDEQRLAELNERRAAPASTVAPQQSEDRPPIDVSQQHDFVQIVGSDRCGLRGCTLGLLEHAWIPAWPSAPASPAALRDEAEHFARRVVGTVFDNTAASHETLKQAMIERIADSVTPPSTLAKAVASKIASYLFANIFHPARQGGISESQEVEIATIIERCLAAGK